MQTDTPPRLLGSLMAAQWHYSCHAWLCALHGYILSCMCLQFCHLHPDVVSPDCLISHQSIWQPPSRACIKSVNLMWQPWHILKPGCFNLRQRLFVLLFVVLFVVLFVEPCPGEEF